MSSHDKQKEMSKKWIADSFITLMKTKPYEQITISEIAANADLARRTFYRAFSSKNDVIAYIVENLVREYINELTLPTPLNMKSLALVFFGFFEKHRELILCFRHNHLEYFILESFNQYLPYIRTQTCKEKISDDPRVDKLFALMSGGAFFNLLMYWSEDNSGLTPDDLSELIPQAVAIFSQYNAE